MPNFLLLGGRAFQLLCAAVVLGLSANLYKYIGTARQICDALHDKCHLGGLQPAVGYSAFVGAWGLLDALVGVVAEFVDAVPWIVTAGVDGLANIFYLAGGIRLAILLSVGTCEGGGKYCTQLKADSAFMFLGFLATLAIVAVGFFWQRRGKGGVSAV